MSVAATIVVVGAKGGGVAPVESGANSLPAIGAAGSEKNLRSSDTSVLFRMQWEAHLHAFDTGVGARAGVGNGNSQAVQADAEPGVEAKELDIYGKGRDRGKTAADTSLPRSETAEGKTRLESSTDQQSGAASLQPGDLQALAASAVARFMKPTTVLREPDGPETSKAAGQAAQNKSAETRPARPVEQAPNGAEGDAQAAVAASVTPQVPAMPAPEPEVGGGTRGHLKPAEGSNLQLQQAKAAGGVAETSGKTAVRAETILRPMGDTTSHDSLTEQAADTFAFSSPPKSAAQLSQAAAGREEGRTRNSYSETQPAPTQGAPAPVPNLDSGPDGAKSVPASVFGDEDSNAGGNQHATQRADGGRQSEIKTSRADALAKSADRVAGPGRGAEASISKAAPAAGPVAPATVPPHSTPSYMVYGSRAESSESDAFAAIDRGTGVGATTWIHAGFHRAEAGFDDPVLGWVGVRAGTMGDGIHATLLPGSAEAAQTLSGHLSGLNAYLSEHHAEVSKLTMALPSSNGLSSGSESNGQQDTHPHDAQSNSAAAQALSHGVGTVQAAGRADSNGDRAGLDAPDGWRGSRISVLA